MGFLSLSVPFFPLVKLPTTLLVGFFCKKKQQHNIESTVCSQEDLFERH